MTDVFIYADETGNLDYGGSGKEGASAYFGFGTALFPGEHGDALWDGHVLRSSLADRGFDMPKGFHAKNDLWDIRNEMLALVSMQQPRLDTTFLYKDNAYPYVKAKGWEYLYKLAWYLHLKHVCEWVVESDDHIYVVVATMGTKKRAVLAREAVEDVCRQMNRTITLCMWDAATSWGLQVADYGLWAVHRHLVGGSLRDYDQLVKPLVKTEFTPWGRV